MGVRVLGAALNAVEGPESAYGYSGYDETHDIAQCTKATATRYKSIVRSAILPRLGSPILQHVNPGQIQKVADQRLMEVAPATVRQELPVLSAMYPEPLSGTSRPRNPVNLVAKPKVDNPVVRSL